MQYGETDERFIDDVKKDQQDNIFKPKLGANRIRILPPAHGRKMPWFRFAKHFNFFIGGEIKSFVCPTSLDPTAECPICTFVKQLYDKGDAQSVTLARAIRAKARVILNVLDMDAVGRGPQIWETTATRNYDFDKIKNLYASWGTLHDPMNGHVILVQRSKQEEFLINDIQVLPTHGPLPAELLNNDAIVLTDLETYFTALSVKELEAAIPFGKARMDAPSTGTTLPQAQSIVAAPAQAGPGGNKPRLPKCASKGLFNEKEEECQTCEAQLQCKANKAAMAPTGSVPVTTEQQSQGKSGGAKAIEDLEKELMSSMSNSTPAAPETKTS